MASPATTPVDPYAGTPYAGMSADERDAAIYQRLASGESPGAVNPPPNQAARETDTERERGEPGGPDTTPSGEPRITSRAQALDALQRDGWKEQELAGVADEVLVQRAEARRAQQRHQDRFGSTIGQRLEAIERHMGFGGAAPANGAPARPADPKLEQMAEGLKGRLGEEAAGQLADVLGETRKVMRDLEAQREAEMLEASRSRLKPNWPDLDKPEVFKQVHQRMHELAATGRYREMDALMDDAALLVLGRQNRAAMQDQMMTRHIRETHGQPDVPPQRRDAPTTRTPEERESMAYKLLEQGYTPAQARAAAYG